MTKPFTLVVCGLGRCGTSLAMQLLDKAKYPCYGHYPAYEECDVMNMTIDTLQEHTGQAVKVIDPHMLLQATPAAFKNCRVIYMVRDTKHQALSQLKLIGEFFDMARTNRKDYKRMEANLRQDNRLCTTLFKRIGVPVLRYSFEDLLIQPERFIKDVSRFTGIELDSTNVKGVVIPRTSDCYEGLLEYELLGITDGFTSH